MTASWLPREAPPGSKWVDKTSETNLVGVLVMAATRRPLSGRVQGQARQDFIAAVKAEVDREKP